MIILGHMYHLGWGWGGGVVTMVLLLDELRRRGHEARLMLQRGKWSHDAFGGRPIAMDRNYSQPLPRAKVRAYMEADLIITQGEATGEAMRLAHQYGRPLAHLIHDEGQLRKHGAKRRDVALAIYNSRWTLEAALRESREESAIVVNPLVFPDAFATERGDAICLVNTSLPKGGQLFWALAARMPERRFLAVRGGWGAQIIHALPNVAVMDHQFDPRAIYQHCRIMLMPSQDLGTPGPNPDWTESWGRVAIEAAASGIPTIAHPTPGLVESLGDAGIYADRNDVEAWVKMIEALDDPERYAEACAAALARSAELERMQSAQLDELVAALAEVAAVSRPAVDWHGAVREGRAMKVEALRPFLYQRAVRRREQVFDVPAARARELTEAGLVRIAEGGGAPMIRPEETQQLPPPLERKAPKERTSGVVVTYACAHCRASGFASRDALRDHAATEHGAAVRQMATAGLSRE